MKKGRQPFTSCPESPEEIAYRALFSQPSQRRDPNELNIGAPLGEAIAYGFELLATAEDEPLDHDEEGEEN
jgi:hypothetical protein